MSFEEWLKEEGKTTFDEFKMNEIIEGKTEEEIEEGWDEVKQEYTDFCDENDLDYDFD